MKNLWRASLFLVTSTLLILPSMLRSFQTIRRVGYPGIISSINRGLLEGRRPIYLFDPPGSAFDVPVPQGAPVRHASSASSVSASSSSSKSRTSKPRSSAPVTTTVYGVPPLTPAQIERQKNGIDSYGITVVDTVEKARRAVQALEAHPDHVWGCDTEVADIDVKTQGPVGNGRVICLSIFGGMDVDFGDGPGKALWVETETAAESEAAEREKLLQQGDRKMNEIMSIFKPWFENPRYKKVWHNYGFDRHVMYNENVNCLGFGGDTMHMARLWDTSRDKATGGGAGSGAGGGGEGYSLESLSDYFTRQGSIQLQDSVSKVSMKELFGIAKLKKDGTEGKILELPDLRDVQRNAPTRAEWIQYSARDAVATWLVRVGLEGVLQKMPWVVDGKRLGNMLDFYNRYLLDFGELLTDMERNGIKVDTAGHLKSAETRARAELERMHGIFTDWAAGYCADIKHVNIGSGVQMQQLFFGQYENWELIPGGKDRIFKIDKSEEDLEVERQEAMRINPYASLNATDLKSALKERGIKSSGKKNELVYRLLEHDAYLKLFDLSEDELLQRCAMRGLDLSPLTQEHAELQRQLEIAAVAVAAVASSVPLKPKKVNPPKQTTAKKPPVHPSQAEDEDGADQMSMVGATAALTIDDLRKKFLVDTYWLSELQSADFTAALSEKANTEPPKKHREIIITSIGMKPVDYTPLGVPQVSTSVLKKLAGKDLFGDEKDAIYGDAFNFFGGGESGKAACRAIGALAAVGQLESTINNFLVPLQALTDKNSRIHCSLNLNTETGRLSSRRPNLQNQPALEKDQFKIRDAFVAEEGNTLIVADYGQLELRLMAHMTNCVSMLEAFASGGCFHSRTAVGMYKHIKEAVANGEVLLEWDYSKGQPTVPLVKDTFGSERRKAKTLNFSIAYGKTVHGLALDWDISKEEAQETLDAWYSDRPEVKEWQQGMQGNAKRVQYVRTMMGRYRMLPGAKVKGPAMGHALRAAINTPIQGSAADVVMMAMIKLWKSEQLKKLGWKLLLQIHDEVILEGPKESRDEAMKEVISCMERPFDNFALSKLKVTLDVDAKSADSWYKAK